MNTFIGKWASLYQLVLGTYFDGVTFTMTGTEGDAEYKAEKNRIVVTSKSVVDLERKMFQENMDIK